jgi:acid phosphatase (class A)
MMTRKIFLMAVLYGCSIAATAQPVQTVQPVDAITFTSTQTWSPQLLKWANDAFNTPGIKLNPPPKNSSSTTKAELATLHAYQKERTEENIAEIKRENHIYGALFADEIFAQLINPSKRPRTFALTHDLMITLETVNTMRQKQIYNRVRPSYLDPTLIPVVDVPLHPAYPSGHATQAHLRALVLSQLDPINRTAYMQSAERIARNREIAGVHYPSDSQAGVLLATQLFSVLMNNSDFLEQFKKAKSESAK